MNSEQLSSPENRYAELQKIFDEKRLEKPERKRRFEAVANFAKKLEATYGRKEMEKYRLFHLISSSQPFDDGTVTEFDLPGGEIEYFIREEL